MLAVLHDVEAMPRIHFGASFAAGARDPHSIFDMSCRVGLGVSEDVLGPTFPLMPGQACLPGSGVPHDSPLVGHSLWDFAHTWPCQDFFI